MPTKSNIIKELPTRILRVDTICSIRTGYHSELFFYETDEFWKIENINDNLFKLFQFLKY